MGNEGWAGGVLRRLQTAIRIMVEDSGKMSERLNRSNYPLADLAPTDFPEHLRNRATRILNLRLNGELVDEEYIKGWRERRA